MYYLYQPAFLAQLGLFGNNCTPALLQDFLNAIPGKFRYWDFTLNQGNVFTLDGYLLKPRVNFTLNLNHSYPELYKNYRDNIKRNIKKALQLNCIIRKDIDIDEVLSLSQEQSKTFSKFWAACSISSPGTFPQSLQSCCKKMQDSEYHSLQSPTKCFVLHGP